MILMIHTRNSFRTNSGGLVSFDNTSMFCLASPNTAVGFSTAVHWCFARHCCWHRNCQLPTSVFFMMSLKSLSSSSMKKIQRNFLASSSFGFSIAHFCFAFRFTASDICFHISCHALSGLDVVCFLVSLTSRPCISVRWPFKKISLVKPVHASDSSSNVQYVFPTIHPVTHVLFW